MKPPASFLEQSMGGTLVLSCSVKPEQGVFTIPPLAVPNVAIEDECRD